MKEHVGPTVVVNTNQFTLKDLEWSQEQLALVGLEYALLGYVPVDSRSVVLSVNGAFKLLNTDFNIDGRKIQFTPALQASNDIVVVSYPTASPVSALPITEIEFDIPGQDVRVGSVGALQVLVDGYWYDLIPQVHPITGVITYDVSQVKSLNQ